MNIKKEWDYSILNLRIAQYKVTYFFTDSLWFWIARKMPRKLVYYAIIRAWAWSTGNVHTNKTPDQVTWSMVLKDADKF